ncbi:MULTISPECIES: acid phosphatase [unclassified Acinetobacter]|uniref:acid phosphatase n=1 Tax=unclassified Acinetobacter TaxID=196816 RepID=UPI0019092FB7|nr:MULTISPECIES: phosphatase PAP2 family protein [unclassified Acinetobacter]MBK0062458.1 phosphatase PAP2 family protein [Acinetobacter sp. S55]MBK0066262.1 phosphatase PAP2 family protein [Acinetobacter sp. S54]
MSSFKINTLLLSLISCSVFFTGCNDSHSSDDDISANQETPAAPKGVGYEDTAPLALNITPIVDSWITNQRGDARYATVETNAGVRVLSGFLDVWTPSSLFVDAGVSAQAQDGFPAVTQSNWTGLPADSTDGSKKNADVLNYNINYSVQTTHNRTEEDAIRAYLDDRRGKSYSVTTGMGALTDPWRALTGQTTTINSVPSDANQVKYDDKGNNTGLTTAEGNTNFGKVVEFIQAMGNNSSTEPAKRFYKYARPYRWSTDVIVVPSLESAKSSTPSTDGGFPSGHTAEAGRNAIAMAYLVPQRYQEIIARGMDLGDSRIIAGMHSALDVIGGRLQSIAADVANLNAMTQAQRKEAYSQAQTQLMKATNTSTFEEFYALSKMPYDANDRFADLEKLKKQVDQWMTYGFNQISDKTKTATVPKGAEILLETRFPYLSAEQRRVVLKSTALASGYPVMDDTEGYGRLNLFRAGGGYGNFNGDVYLTMDADLGGFNQYDQWNNDITGEGKLTKLGTGTLALAGNNAFTGGIDLKQGSLELSSENAAAQGDIYMHENSRLNINATKTVNVSGNLTQLSGTTLNVNLQLNTLPAIQVGKTVTLNGTLQLITKTNLPTGTYTVLSAKKLQGSFKRVTLNGKDITANYQNNSVVFTVS